MKHHASLLPTALIASLEVALNAALALDPASVTRFSTLSGRIIAMVVEGPALTLYIAPSDDGVRLMDRFDGEADTTLRGTPAALFRMNRGRTGEAMFNRGITIDGDIELGLRLQRTLAQVNIDWEEHLSRLTGDLIAHQLGNGVRGLFALGHRAVETFKLNSADYLHYETESLATRFEMDRFLGEVDLLRDDVERLAARIQRLTPPTKRQGE